MCRPLGCSLPCRLRDTPDPEFQSPPVPDVFRSGSATENYIQCGAFLVGKSVSDSFASCYAMLLTVCPSVAPNHCVKRSDLFCRTDASERTTLSQLTRNLVCRLLSSLPPPDKERRAACDSWAYCSGRTTQRDTNPHRQTDRYKEGQRMRDRGGARVTSRDPVT